MPKQVINILFIGDIIGRYGRAITKKMIPLLKKEEHFDLIIANGENSASGNGITDKVYNELLAAEIDVLTMGNHVWDKKEILKNISAYHNLLRPANYPNEVPGQRYIIKDTQGIKVGIFNLCGRVFMPALDCPFKKADKIISEIKNQTNLIIVDMHAEATSERQAMGFYLDGRVSAVIGTHTHVQTADERILAGGAAFICDAGMVGAQESIIGMHKKQILQRFLTQMPHKFEVEKNGPAIFNAVLIEIDTVSGKARSIKRVFKRIAETEIKENLFGI